MPIFGKNPKTLSELEEEDERLGVEVSVARKRAIIAALESRAGKGSWRMFSSNGKMSGISFSRITQWLKTH